MMEVTTFLLTRTTNTTQSRRPAPAIGVSFRVIFSSPLTHYFIVILTTIPLNGQNARTAFENAFVHAFLYIMSWLE